MTTFKLNSWSEKLYLFSRGMQLTGNVAITIDESVQQPDAVMVDVIARSDTSSWLHTVQVCSLERKKGEQGVGLFVCPLGSFTSTFAYSPRASPRPVGDRGRNSQNSSLK